MGRGLVPGLALALVPACRRSSNYARSRDEGRALRASTAVGPLPQRSRRRHYRRHYRRRRRRRHRRPRRRLQRRESPHCWRRRRRRRRRCRELAEPPHHLASPAQHLRRRCSCSRHRRRHRRSEPRRLRLRSCHRRRRRRRRRRLRLLRPSRHRLPRPCRESPPSSGAPRHGTGDAPLRSRPAVALRAPASG